MAAFDAYLADGPGPQLLRGSVLSGRRRLGCENRSRPRARSGPGKANQAAASAVTA
ncbi:hypothetical protein GCM10018780_77490 [Streptomyces lanatus]|nr:hypothetical protein GCM10018780_77490 [Streptomyces lanatus]